MIDNNKEKDIAKIKAVFESGELLKVLVPDMSRAKIYRYCAEDLPEETYKYLKEKAEVFTQRREMIHRGRFIRNIMGIQAQGLSLEEPFDCILKKVVAEVYLLQKDVFIRGNARQLNILRDIWNIYYLDGENLRSYKYNFTVVKAPLFRLELKYYYKNELKSRWTARLLCLLSAAINHLTDVNNYVRSFADITESGAAVIYAFLENDYVTACNKSVAPKTVQMAIMEFKHIVKYLMSIERDSKLKTAIPSINYFVKYSFRNIVNMYTPTIPLPECVVDGIVAYMDELGDKYKMMVKIFMYSGLRAKEVSLLKTDCIGEKVETGCVHLKYIPYKVIAQRRRSGLSDESTVLISEKFAAELSEYIDKTTELRNDSLYVFAENQYNLRSVTPNSMSVYCAVNRLIKKHNICDETGQLWKFSSRQFRKTVAVTMIENGASVAEVAYMLGHFGLETAKRYYDDVRKMKLAQMNTEFFKAQFDVIIDREQLTKFTEEQRKCLYLDFCLRQRSVELGFCLKPFDSQGCTERNRLNSCVNCRNLCTGGKYLEYWNRLRDEQQTLVDSLIAHYEEHNILDYETFKEFKREKMLLDSYSNAIKHIEDGGNRDEK